jgi:hypothetical protein
LDRCGGLQRVEFRGCPGLRVVDVHKCWALTTVELAGVTSLRELSIRSCEQLEEVCGLETLGALKRMVVEWGRGLGKLEAGGLTALQELTIRGCGKLPQVRLLPCCCQRGVWSHLLGGYIPACGVHWDPLPYRATP